MAVMTTSSREAGNLFAVSGDEGDGCAALEKCGGLTDLFFVNLQDLGNGLNIYVLVNHSGSIRKGWNIEPGIIPGLFPACSNAVFEIS
jgi:hypothetical protein